MRIFFTGGSGKAGKHVAPYLAARGHRVTNADLVPLEHPDVADLRVDLTDAGETYSALAGLATFDELDLPEKPSYDAVVHFAAVPAILLRPDAVTYATNVLSTYNVLEAATRLGVRKIVFASSETTYGICFAQGERRPLYVPVDEEHPTVPEDSYAMSKVANEVTARSFHARTGADIYGLRINNVIEPHEYADLFPPFLDDPSLRRRNVFAYIDTRDLGQIVQRCLETDGLGYEVFNVANADMSVAATTQEIRDTFYDDVEVRKEMTRDETFYSIDKAKELLGFDPRHSWRDVLARDPMTDPEKTDDGRYIVVDGRKWRATDPAIPEGRRAELTTMLMALRRDVRRTHGTDDEPETRAGVQAAKVALGERGTPWWEQSDDERRARWSAEVPMPPDR